MFGGCVCGEVYYGRRYGWEICMWRGVLWEEVWVGVVERGMCDEAWVGGGWGGVNVERGIVGRGIIM